MQSPPPAFPVEQHRVEVATQEGLPNKMFCMDERFNLAGLLGWQHAGGPDGLGRDYGTAMEMQKPGSFVNQNIPIHVMGSLFNKIFRAEGIDTFMHDPCAAYQGALVVRKTMFEKMQAIKEITPKMGYELTDELNERQAEASWRIAKSGLIIPTEHSDRDLIAGIEDRDLPPVPRLELVGGDHIANDMVIDNTREAVWDAESAYKSGSPAYYSGLGWLRVAHRIIEPHIPVDYELLEAAAFSRLAAISENLPRPNGQPLNIHSIGEAA